MNDLDWDYLVGWARRATLALLSCQGELAKELDGKVDDPNSVAAMVATGDYLLTSLPEGQRVRRLASRVERLGREARCLAAALQFVLVHMSVDLLREIYARCHPAALQSAQPERGQPKIELDYHFPAGTTDFARFTPKGKTVPAVLVRTRQSLVMGDFVISVYQCNPHRFLEGRFEEGNLLDRLRLDPEAEREWWLNPTILRRIEGALRRLL